MSSLEIHDLSPEILGALAGRAAASGRSLNAYLVLELTAIAQRTARPRYAAHPYDRQASQRPGR